MPSLIFVLLLPLFLFLASCTPRIQVQASSDLDTRGPSFVATIAAHTDAQFLSGNRVEILLDGDQTFPPMLRAIRSARRSVTFAEYFFADGPIADEIVHALAERCAARVKVHVLLDSFGASAIPAELIARMESSGCEVEWFRRIKIPQFVTPWTLLRYNNRNHRRIVVVDGTLGFTGGYGISEAWMGNGRDPEHWRDTNVQIEGPVVQQLQAAFVQNWRETTGKALGGDDYFPVLEPTGDVAAQIVKSSPTGGASESYVMFLLAIFSARRSISITNPYFVLDRQMQQALIDAVRRGVRVIALIPGRLEAPIRVDQNLVHYAGRSGFGPLLEAGVRIFEYKAALLHAKTMVVDGTWATVGSTNLDRRSFALNQELNLTVYDAGVAERLEAIFAEDLRFSKELTYEKWKSRGLWPRFMGWFAWPAKSQL